eukprot:scaffold7806_cov250-Ochromonas_danica.AAC.3
MMISFYSLTQLFFFFFFFLSSALALSGRLFFHLPTQGNPPQLILISGCTGTGKSTFGMTVALNQGILRCISTDSIRQVMRSYSQEEALHRSSYSGEGDPILQWKECCHVLNGSVNSLVEDAIRRGISLVIEGVHIVPSNEYLDLWRKAGGVALGCVLVIKDAESHRDLIFRRGEVTRRGAEGQIKAFNRIRIIQEEMCRLAEDHGWLLIEQKLEPDPVDVITDLLAGESHASLLDKHKDPGL